MISARRFEPADAEAVSVLITRTLRTTNIRDYGAEYIENHCTLFTPEKVLVRAGWSHFYVFCDGNQIVACGGVAPYEGRLDECFLLTIFVLPEYQGRGIGRKIIETLEADEYALRSKRIDLPASITGRDFYLKFGYAYKGGIKDLYPDRCYRLEKFL